jgi:hypothetical protein
LVVLLGDLSGVANADKQAPGECVRIALRRVEKVSAASAIASLNPDDDYREHR